jgi:hypothetical protein
MDLSVIFQLRNKKFWWMDVIFYFVVSLLVATVFCYFVLSFKNGMIKQQIADTTLKLKEVGTLQQKQHEADVMVYQKKIGDFTILLKNHQFVSNVFAFMQAQTMPNIWFSQFNLDEKSASVQLNGEANNLDDFSRQVAVLEKNKYVKSVGAFNASLGEAAREQFNIGLSLDQSIFSYLPNISSVANSLPVKTPATSTAPVVNQNLPGVTVPPSAKTPATSTASVINQNTSGSTVPPSTQPGNSQKLINSFHILDPKVVGQVDQTNYSITINVPSDTDVKKLTPEIVVSPGAVVHPESLLAQDFTNPITYKVVAIDGSTQDYRVTVTVEPAQASANKKSNPLESPILIIIISVVTVIIILVVVILLIRRKNKRMQ